MVSSQPHFLLVSRATSQSAQRRELSQSQAGSSVEQGDQPDVMGEPLIGTWHFLLESMDGKVVVEASDQEPYLRAERLELLAVVRGLEALDQPSRVTLVTSCRQISRGFRHGLDEWRGNDWQWERDGRWVPIKNSDLWRRVDRALKFHHVKCRTLRSDDVEPLAGPHYLSATRQPATVGASGAATVTRRHGQSATTHPARRLKQRLTAAYQAFMGGVEHVPDWSHSAQLSN